MKDRQPNIPQKYSMPKVPLWAKVALGGAMLLTSDEPIGPVVPEDHVGNNQPPQSEVVPTVTQFAPTEILGVTPTISPLLTPTMLITETPRVEIAGVPEELKDYDGYRVVGSKIYNSNGEEIVFRGFWRPGLEWSPTGDGQETPERAGYAQMADLGANVVRLSLNQVFWLSIPEYKETVKQQVEWANNEGLNVILDLHWSGRNELKDYAGQTMPDDYSLDFWSQVAETFKENQSVLFEAHNEPILSPEESVLWLSGGQTRDGFETPGMQEIYDAIRGKGAMNIIIFNGRDYGFQHQGLGTVEGVNIVYGTHPYGHHNGKNTIEDIANAAGFLIDQGKAVMITEFGHIEGPEHGVAGVCDSKFYETVSRFAQDNGYAGWVVSAWWGDLNTSEPDRTCGFPGVIKKLEPDFPEDYFPTGIDIANSLSTPMPNGSVVDAVK